MSAVKTLETRTTATFLAKEGIELAYNLRDSNLAQWYDWNCLPKDEIASLNEAPQDICSYYLASWNAVDKILKIWFSPEKYMYYDLVDAKDLFDTTRLSHIEGSGFSWYGYDWLDDQKSMFARYLVFTGVVENKEILPKDKILKLESHVIWQQWSSMWEVVLESFIWNY